MLLSTFANQVVSMRFRPQVFNFWVFLNSTDSDWLLSILLTNLYPNQLHYVQFPVLQQDHTVDCTSLASLGLQLDTHSVPYTNPLVAVAEWRFLTLWHTVYRWSVWLLYHCWSWKVVSRITAWEFQWMGLPHSLKTDRDYLIEDNHEIQYAVYSAPVCPGQILLCCLYESPQSIS